MRKVLLACCVAAVATGALAAPAPAGAATLKELAQRECREDRRQEPREFRGDYGGTGKAARRRCVRDKRRDAVRDCREDRREDRAEFRREHGGTGRAALRRCAREDLR